jgi:hypothetical protein
MKPFRIQFVCFRTSPEALRLWEELGLTEWIHDQVERKHHWGVETCHLRISHEAMRAPKYMNIHLSPHSGEVPRVTHVGMRCTAEEAEEYRRFFSQRGIPIRAEYTTISHTSVPGRRFHDIYFATAAILGVDIEVSVDISQNAPVL